MKLPNFFERLALNEAMFGAEQQMQGTTNASSVRRTEMRTQLDGTYTATDGQQIRIPLNKQSLVEEHIIRIQASQLYAGGAPTGSDVRRFISSISIESSDGRRKFMTGYQAYDTARFTEQNSAQPVVALGSTTVASTADYQFNLHHANDQAKHDMMAAIAAAKLNTFDCVITFAPQTNNGFTGGTLGSTPVCSYTATVRNNNFPGMLVNAQGQPNKWVERLRHVNESQSYAGAAGGGSTAPNLRLTAGNKTRFITLHCFDLTGTNPVPSDNVVSNIRLNINGQERRITDYITQQKQNSTDRHIYIPGFAVLDFGDDEAGWLDLRGVSEPYLSYDIVASPPATWRVDFGQDFNLIMPKTA